MSKMNLSRALRYKKRLVEKIRKLEQDIQSNNSYLVGNIQEVNVHSLYETRQNLVIELLSLKVTLQTATQPIMKQILELAEAKAEIVFWQRVDTTFGFQKEQYSDSPPSEYFAVYRKSWVDEKISTLQDQIDALQTSIDAYNNSNSITQLENGLFEISLPDMRDF